MAAERRMTTAGIDVLAPSLDQLTQRRVHVSGELVKRQHEDDALAGTKEFLAKRHVFRHAMADGGVSADGIVGITTHENELPVRDHVDRAPRLTHVFRTTVANRQQSEHLRLDDALPEAVHL